jgi:putative addiction module killer protein
VTDGCFRKACETLARFVGFFLHGDGFISLLPLVCMGHVAPAIDDGGLDQVRTHLGQMSSKPVVALGSNLGDIKAVGEGVWEMREFFGPGWRMYYIQQGDVLIVMLGGGDKTSQSADIAAALELARLFKE